jgi:hypothetical protein
VVVARGLDEQIEEAFVGGDDLEPHAGNMPAGSDNRNPPGG